MEQEQSQKKVKKDKLELLSFQKNAVNQYEKEQFKPEVKKKVLEFTKHIEAKIWETPLNSKRPPYFQTTFSKWRSQSLQALQHYLKTAPFNVQQEYQRAFIQQVDDSYLPDFVMKLKQQYFDQVYFDNYGVPNNIDLHKIKHSKENEISQEIQKLAYKITEWCIQIEISVDIIDRAEEMGLYKSKKKEAVIFKDLNKQLKGERVLTYTDKAKQLFKQGLSYGMKSLSGMLWSNGMSYTNITYGSLVLIYYTFMGTGSIAIQTLIPASKIAYVAGGLAGSYALGEIAKKVDADDLQLELSDLTTVFKDISENLKDFNAKSQECILKCFQAQSQEEKSQLQKELEINFVDLIERTEKFKEQRDQIMQIKNLVETEIEDDWTVLGAMKNTSDDQELQEQNKLLLENNVIDNQGLEMMEGNQQQQIEQETQKQKQKQE